MKTLFLEGDLEGTFTFYHFLSLSFWKILLTLVLLFFYFFYSSHYTPLSLCYYFVLLFHSLLAHFLSHGSVNLVLLFYSFLFHSSS